MYQRILFPTDGSVISSKALQQALDLAKLAGAELLVLSVKEPYPYSALSEVQPVAPQAYFDATERLAAAHVTAALAAAAAAGVKASGATVEAVHAWEAILDHAKETACDLVVMASHGRRGISALLLGSETQKVLTHSTIPVLVVR